MSVRAPFVVPALKKHTATVIMAHGLGDRYVHSYPRLPFASYNWLPAEYLTD